MAEQQYYHPGILQTNGSGKKVWTCCSKRPSSPGCAVHFNYCQKATIKRGSKSLAALPISIFNLIINEQL